MATLDAALAILGTVQASQERMETKLDTVVVGLAKTESSCEETRRDVEEMRAHCEDRSGKISERVKLIEQVQATDKGYRNGKRAAENTTPQWLPIVLKITALVLAGMAAGAGGPSLFKALLGM